MSNYAFDNPPEMESDNYPPVAFYFKVVFKVKSGVLDDDTSFQDVSGIGYEMGTKEYVEGGENSFVHYLPEQVKTQKLVLKRGIAPRRSQLISWCRAILEGGFARKIVPRQIEVRLMNAEGTPIRGWSFNNAYPVKWSVDNFNSTKNEVAIETIELRYSEFSRVV